MKSTLTLSSCRRLFVRSCNVSDLIKKSDFWVKNCQKLTLPEKKNSFIFGSRICWQHRNSKPKRSILFPISEMANRAMWYQNFSKIFVVFLLWFLQDRLLTFFSYICLVIMKFTNTHCYVTSDCNYFFFRKLDMTYFLFLTFTESTSS